jgi:hypothetical protein
MNRKDAKGAKVSGFSSRSLRLCGSTKSSAFSAGNQRSIHEEARHV